MKLIIAIVLGTLMFQGSTLQFPRRGNGKRTGRNFETRILENMLQDNTREKRSTGNMGKERHTNNRNVQIFHRYQYFLQVLTDGTVNGTKDIFNLNTVFRMETYGTSKVRLFNIEQQRYIAIDDNGFVVSEEKKSNNSLFWEHNLPSGYVRFSLAKYKRDVWLLSLKKNGRTKNARRTDAKMKSTNFFLL